MTRNECGHFPAKLSIFSTRNEDGRGKKSQTHLKMETIFGLFIARNIENGGEIFAHNCATEKRQLQPHSTRKMKN